MLLCPNVHIGKKILNPVHIAVSESETQTIYVPFLQLLLLQASDPLSASFSTFFCKPMPQWFTGHPAKLLIVI